MARDIYAETTNAIIAMLEAGTRPWTPSWDRGADLPRRANGEAYKGINVPILWCAAMTAGYAVPTWLTYKQAAAHGAHVRKGEKGCVVVYASTLVKKGKDANGDDAVEAIPFLKAYTVFNVGQIEGLPAHFYARPETRNADQRKADADAVMTRAGATIVHGGSRAFYQPSEDLIRLPEFSAFKDADSYYAVAFHELGHWTGAEKRLNRVFGKRFGDKAYAAEELVAEMTAAFVCASVGISAEPREDHASYLDSWLRILKADKRAIFTAASAAQRACDFIVSASHATDAAAA